MRKPVVIDVTKLCSFLGNQNLNKRNYFKVKKENIERRQLSSYMRHAEDKSKQVQKHISFAQSPALFYLFHLHLSMPYREPVPSSIGCRMRKQVLRKPVLREALLIEEII